MSGGKEYVKWAADMALSLDTGVPWIDSCNAFYCDGFRPNSYRKPALWTEDWNGWYDGAYHYGSLEQTQNYAYFRYASWGGRVPHRPVKDNAFAVARFFQRGGSFHNYYMVV
ncbi:hypothetical protein GW17_00000417 [Ensete ventricosum]|nr:hypothetical protein GW17_00000417 [Ensete ventricosum]RZR83055.1 hypothetical protein BHM03_00009592 [Ensete ventricosum]